LAKRRKRKKIRKKEEDLVEVIGDSQFVELGEKL